MRTLLLLLAVGCQSGTAETGEVPAHCSDAPVLTWANFGESFLTQYCQACHSASSPNRNGAPEDVRFDTEEEAWSWAEEILSVTTSTPPRMPPEGGVHEDDQQKLTWWLDCN